MGAPSRLQGGFQVVIDPSAWYYFKQELDAFDPELARALRRRIKNAGNMARARVIAELEKPTPGGKPLSSEGRAALIAATKTSVSFGKRAAGTRITTSSQKLSDDHKGLLFVYNKKTFRHPVYDSNDTPRSTWNWVPQQGRPYFGSAIQKALNREIIAEIRAALADAFRSMHVQNPGS